MKTAIITGASNGIGFSTAQQLAETSNVIAISRDQQKLKILSESAKAKNIFTIPFNLLQFDQYPQLLQKIISISPTIDILINNAGYLINKPFTQLTHNNWLEIYNLNIIAPALLIRLLHPHFPQQSPSHIINISSMGGMQGSLKYPGLSAYSSSKGALAIFTECLAEEFKDQNIKVNCLALGAVQTQMLSLAFPQFSAPLTPPQIAPFISWFALNGHQYFNGKILPVAQSNP